MTLSPHQKVLVRLHAHDLSHDTSHFESRFPKNVVNVQDLCWNDGERQASFWIEKEEEESS